MEWLSRPSGLPNLSILLQASERPVSLLADNNGQSSDSVILFVESPGSKKRRIGALIALLMLLVSLAFLMNDYRLSESGPEEIRREKTWARSGIMPDIMISGIQVQPHVPLAGEPFSLSVFCQNIGIVRSGAYSISVSVTEEDGKEVFTDHAFLDKTLDPGQTGAAFSASIMFDDMPGRYSISVEVTPEGFEDLNAENNRSVKVIDMR